MGRMMTVTICTLLVIPVSGCDAGSDIDISPSGDSCEVTMSSNSKDFVVEMTLQCDASGADCYTITSLSCQGVAKDEEPIVLTGDADSCPGRGYCIDDCAEGLNAPGMLWDTPSLLAVSGCNIYEDGP